MDSHPNANLPSTSTSWGQPVGPLPQSLSLAGTRRDLPVENNLQLRSRLLQMIVTNEQHRKTRNAAK